MSDAAQKILTIIIPTRDRADTLVHSLRTATSQPNQEIEILVSDNFSGPEVKQVVEAANDERVRYIRTNERMGMSEHWDFAIENAKGDWITIVGDDDGLLPGAVDKFISLAKKHPEIKAITAINCSYRWPSENTLPQARLVSGHGYNIRNGRESLKRTMQGEIIALPSIYTGGFVHKDMINEIKNRSPDKKFFQALAPDVYSGIAISSIIDKYIYSWEPLAIAGASRHSTGSQHRNKTQDEIKKLDLYTESKHQWMPSLGKGFGIESMQIILYESFLQSQHLRDYDLGVNLANQLEVSILTSGNRVRKKIIECCRDIANINGIEFEPILNSAMKKKPLYNAKKLANKFIRRIPGLSKSRRSAIADARLENVYDAAKEMDKLLSA